MSKNKRNPDVLEVVWEDHCDIGGTWNHISNIKRLSRPAIIRTVGSVVFEDKHVLVMSPMYVVGEDTVSTPTLIIKKCVRSRKVIKKGKKRKK